MAQQEREEKEKERQRKEKASDLMQQRSPALQGKIRRMLKTTKSANKSVLADAVDNNDTAYTMNGPEQPDEDDYGYESLEASKLYRNMMDKYSTMPEEKKFSDSHSKERSKSELLAAKDRVRQAIIREKEEELHVRRRGSSSATSSSTSTKTSDDPVIRHRQRKNLYDPTAEREEEERRKREEEEERRRKARLKKPPPPIMDFKKLLQLAEKKQHEPVEAEVLLKPKQKEPERLLTKKEKQELEAKKAYMAERERRRIEAENPSKARRPEDSRGDGARPVNRMAPNGRIPKLNSTGPSTDRPSLDKKRPPEQNGRSPISKPSTTYGSSTSKSTSSNKYDDRRPSAPSNSANRRPDLPQKSSNVPTNSAKTAPASGSNILKSALTKSSQGRSPVNGKSAKDTNRNDIKTREFPPKDVRRELPKDTKTRPFPPKDMKTREFPPKDFKTREFPPKDLKTRDFPPKDLKSAPAKTREFPPRDNRTTRDFPPRDGRFAGRTGGGGGGGPPRKPMAQKRRIMDDDSEYDSEMDDFIDDDPGAEDYSKYIKEIFGYDKSRYRHLDDDVDNMESSFAQQMREEQLSKKMGLMEDLEDMRMEAEEKKRKKKRRRISDDDDD